MEQYYANHQHLQTHLMFLTCVLRSCVSSNIFLTVYQRVLVVRIAMLSYVVLQHYIVLLYYSLCHFSFITSFTPFSGTELPNVCWCAGRKLTTHSCTLCHLSHYIGFIFFIITHSISDFLGVIIVLSLRVWRMWGCVWRTHVISICHCF